MFCTVIRDTAILKCLRCSWPTQAHSMASGVSSLSECNVLQSVNPAAIDGFKQENLYDKTRPSYTNAAVDFIKELLFSVKKDESKNNRGDNYDIVEVGSGTGKFTDSFMRRIDQPIRYLATEPLGNMLEVIKQKCPEVITLQCAAESLDLSDASAKIVVAAQSFHWFANLASLTQIHRVLVPGGRLVLIWNSRDASVPWIGELDGVLDGMYKECATERQQNRAWMKVFDTFSGFEDIQHRTQPAPSIKGSLEDILRYFSTISVLSISEENMNVVAKFIRNHRDLQGLSDITVPFVTDVFWCCKKI